MTDSRCIEERMCIDYVKRSTNEIPYENWVECQKHFPSLITVEGFEERSLGLLRRFDKLQACLPSVVIAQYGNDKQLNRRFRNDFNNLAEKTSSGNWTSIDIDPEGKWVQDALDFSKRGQVIIDITGLTKRLLFGVLDHAAASPRQILVGYTEAEEYWPKKSDWEKLFAEFGEAEQSSLSESFDKKPWLYSYENKIELVSEHEGYDVAGNKRALIGFLTFKCARLAAILLEEDYSEYKFIAGLPRLDRNWWRCEVQKRVNASIIDQWPVIEMSTFGYRQTITQLASLIFGENRLLERFNVCLAPMGSKLQTVGCWVVSNMCRAITVVTSVPVKYYPDAFSDGIGQSWVFPLTKR